MSNQDINLNDVMPAGEQTEILQAALLEHHLAVMKQLTAHFDMIEASPGAMTPEVVAFFEEAIEAQVQWLASHGIYFPDTAEPQVGDNG